MVDNATTKVAVAVRIRPLNENELRGEASIGEMGLIPLESNAVECINAINSHKQIIAGSDNLFTFDHVFGTDCGQRVIYDECVDSLLNAAFEGFNATILAYGQTGSGKTWTMGSAITSPNENNDFSSEVSRRFVEDDNDGIIPRVIKNLYRMIDDKEQQDVNSTYKVFVQFLEIYGEDIRDLLDETKTSKVNIRETPAGEVFVAGAKEELVTSFEQMIKCLEDGTKHRTTAATKMNQTSSRSHAIFTITIEHTIHSTSPNLSAAPTTTTTSISAAVEDESPDDEETAPPVVPNTRGNGQAEVRRSKFHFVDLAGSERAKRTGAQGNTLKEGIDINKGLLALGNVISALGDDHKRGKVFVPYRDSKLTRMLQDSLGGNSKTLMICCVSPAIVNFNESVNALRYANRARNIKNKPVLNRDPALMIIDELKQIVATVSSELLEIKRKKRYEERQDSVPIAQLELWCAGNSGSGSSGGNSFSMGSSSQPVSTVTNNTTRKTFQPSQKSKANSELLFLREQVSSGDFEIRRLNDQVSSMRKEVSQASDELVRVKSELCYFKHKWEEACPEEGKALAMASFDETSSLPLDINPSNEEIDNSALASRLVDEKQRDVAAFSDFIREIEDLKKQLGKERLSKRLECDSGVTLSGFEGSSGVLLSIQDDDTSSIELLIAQTREQLELEYNRLKVVELSSTDKDQRQDVSQSSPDSIASQSESTQDLKNENLHDLVESTLQSTRLEDDAKEHNRRQQILFTEVTELEQSIHLKEQLLSQLERGQSQYSAMKQFYEQKLQLLSIEMETKEKEREILQQELQTQLQIEQQHANAPGQDSSKSKANKDKEKLLTAQLAKKDEELRLLKKRQDELNHLSQVQSRYLQQKSKLEEDIAAMKKQKVSLSRELQLQRKRYTSSLNDKAREIDKLKRELMRTASNMKKLTKDKEAAEIRARDAYLSRLALSSSVNASKKQSSQSNTQTSNNPINNNNSNTTANQSGSSKSASKMSAIKAMKEVARMTRNINGSINRILSSDDLHTKKWLEKRLLSIAQEEAAVDILKKLCQTQMELLNKKAVLERDPEQQQQQPYLDADVAEKIQQLDSRIEDIEKQIKDVGQKIQNNGEARAVFYEKTLDVLLHSALSNTHGAQTPRQQDLVRLLFDMLVSSYKRLQVSAIEELDADAREKLLKQRIQEMHTTHSSTRRMYEINLTKLATDYEQKLEGIFKNINDSTISMLRSDDPQRASPPSTPSDVSPSDSERDTVTASNASTHHNSMSTGVESVQLSLVVEECHLLRSQLARSALNSDELASRCSELEFANHRLCREQEERDFQIKFLEEDRSLFKDMVDDLKASLLAMGKEGKNIIDTVKDRASQKRKMSMKSKEANTDQANSSPYSINYKSLIEDAEDGEDEEDSGWDPESTTIILDEFNLISDEIRYGEWPQVSPNNRGPPPAISVSSPKMHTLTQVSVPSHVNVPVYDRLANPSYYTGHMRNVFDDKNIEQKRKKVQKIKSQERKATPVSSDWNGGGSNSTSTTSNANLGVRKVTAMNDLLCSSSIGDSKDEPFDRISIQTASSKSSGRRISLAGLSAQRPKRVLNRTDSADWVMSTDDLLNAPPSGPSSTRHVRTNSFSTMTASVSSSRTDSSRRNSVGAVLPPPPPPPQSRRDRKDSSSEESSAIIILQEDKLPNHMQVQEQVQAHDSMIIREI